MNRNARSILNKVDVIESIILEHEPDIVVITETWLHKDVLDSEVTPPNYTIVRKDREGRGGGVAIMIQNNIQFSALDEVCDVEALWIKTKLNNSTVFIGGMYRPPNSPADVMIKLQTYMDLNLRHEDNILLLGDINLPGVDWLSLSPGSTEVASCDQLIEPAFCYNLTQVVTDHTRVTSTRSSILDLVFISARLKSFLSGCETIEGPSDHKMVLASFEMTPNITHKYSQKTFLNFGAADDVSMLDYLEESLDDLTFLFQYNASTDTLWNFFTNMTKQCLERFIPKYNKKLGTKTPGLIGK